MLSAALTWFGVTLLFNKKRFKFKAKNYRKHLKNDGSTSYTRNLVQDFLKETIRNVTSKKKKME